MQAAALLSLVCLLVWCPRASSALEGPPTKVRSSKGLHGGAWPGSSHDLDIARAQHAGGRVSYSLPGQSAWWHTLAKVMEKTTEALISVPRKDLMAHLSAYQDLTGILASCPASLLLCRHVTVTRVLPRVFIGRMRVSPQACSIAASDFMLRSHALHSGARCTCPHNVLGADTMVNMASHYISEGEHGLEARVRDDLQKSFSELLECAHVMNEALHGLLCRHKCSVQLLRLRSECACITCS